MVGLQDFFIFFIRNTCIQVTEFVWKLFIDVADTDRHDICNDTKASLSVERQMELVDRMSSPSVPAAISFSCSLHRVLVTPTSGKWGSRGMMRKFMVGSFQREFHVRVIG